MVPDVRRRRAPQRLPTSPGERMGATVLPTEQARTLAFVRHADGDTALGLDGAKRPTSGLPSEQAPDSPRAALDALPRRRRWLKVQVVNTPPPQNPLRPVTGEITIGPDMLRDLRQILRCLFPSSGVNARPALAAGD